MSISSIGQILTEQDVEDAYLQTLKTWLPVYLDEVEAQRGLEPGTIPRPPSPECYYGGLDFLNVQEQNMPAVIVKVVPVEDAIHYGSGDWAQWFEVYVAAVVSAEEEHTARLRARVYGGAVMTAIGQNEDLGGFAVRTMLLEAPETQFLADDPKLRLAAQSITPFRTLVDGVFNETATPPAPAWPPPDVPQATSTNPTFTAVPVDEPLDG